MTTLIWFAVVDGILGLLICSLALLFYMQVSIVNKLKVQVKILIGKKPKNWDAIVKNVWRLDDE